RYKDKVKYWLTFNEINMLLFLPYVGGGLVFTKEEDPKQAIYQAAHHQLVASALAVKAGHEIISYVKIGCMLAAGSYYPYSCNPDDVWAAIQADRASYFFTDVQVFGEYPGYVKRFLQENQIEIAMEEGDLDILKEGTVDYVGFSYYSS